MNKPDAIVSLNVENEEGTHDFEYFDPSKVQSTVKLINLAIFKSSDEIMSTK